VTEAAEPARQPAAQAVARARQPAAQAAAPSTRPALADAAKKALLDIYACSAADITAESTFLHDARQANIAAHFTF
jgi:hypothetical protein